MRIIKPIESILALVLLSIILYLLLELQWILVAGFAIGLLGALNSRIAAKVAWCWNLLTKSISTIVSPLVLSIIFFLLLTPIAWLYQIFSKNTFAKRKGKSFYQFREHTFRPEDLENPW